MTDATKKKIVFLTKIAGWLCLVPASMYLLLFQLNSGLANLAIFELLVTIIFATVILLSNQTGLCYNRKVMFRLAIFAILFVSPVVSIPLFLAAKKIPN
ncbi:hypothetical protein [Lactobacillus psittaci]|uniref:Uncharacterized protein n=1 Tax=Lactobacillus psittaci DSM 15354 TaxID=1122152 RepID=A0A0R1SA37_9LACO|nr:hypothetical protein [Lactobacillus psittaci]KRL63000.1 hypothetical protein FC23_GL001184 [Lactobacillus psittaci DSM 15354]